MMQVILDFLGVLVDLTVGFSFVCGWYNILFTF